MIALDGRSEEVRVAFPIWVTGALPPEAEAPAPVRPAASEGMVRSAGALGTTDVVLTDLLGGDPPEWQERALCPQTDPEAFFPDKGGSTREAKRICTRCEVRAECLEYALGREERYGIWGGLSERERRKLKRRAA